MTTLADRTIADLHTVHDGLLAVVPGLSDAQLTGPSGAADWPVAQVLSHLGSGAEITLARLQADTGTGPTPPEDHNQKVWDRWNAMSPKEQAAGFVDHDTALVDAFAALTAEQRSTVMFDVGFLPAPLSVASFAAMRLSEAALHAWDVQVALDPGAALDPTVAQTLAEHYTSGLSPLLGFIGKADRLAHPTTVAIGDSGFGIAVADGVTLVASVTDPTATFTGPLEAAIRLISGRLTPEHTPAGTEVTGDVTLDDLRAVFPGF